MTDTCPRFGKWFGGCRFEPRYDTPAPLHGLSDGFWTTITIDGIKADADKVRALTGAPVKKYVRDVCVRCGKAVDRKP